MQWPSMVFRQGRLSSGEEVFFHYNQFYCPAEQVQIMQNIPSMSFFYMANPMNFYTLVPITPTPTEISTPASEHAFSSTGFAFPGQIDNAYYAHDSLSNQMDLQKRTNQFRMISSLSNFQCSDEEASNSRKMTPIIPTPCLVAHEQQLPPKMEEVSLLTSKEGKPRQLRTKRQPKKGKTPKCDQEYHPESDKTPKASSKYQINQNRNVVPNQINQIFSFVQKENKSGHLVSKLFSKYSYPKEYSIKRFYLYQSLLKNRLGHYSNEKSMKIVTELYEPKCENWSEQEQRFYNKICRILIHHFLHEDSIFIILTSRRMKREKKCDHLRARRQIAVSVDCILQGF